MHRVTSCQLQAPICLVNPILGPPTPWTQLDPTTDAICRPEIQATVKAPAVRNFRMAVTLYYIFAMSLWILVTVIGYW